MPRRRALTEGRVEGLLALSFEEPVLARHQRPPGPTGNCS